MNGPLRDDLPADRSALGERRVTLPGIDETSLVVPDGVAPGVPAGASAPRGARSAGLQSVAAAIVNGLTGALAGVLTARALGPNDRGALAALQAAPLLVMAFALLGLDDALTRFVGRGELAVGKARRLAHTWILGWTIVVALLLWPLNTLTIMHGTFPVEAAIVAAVTPAFLLQRVYCGILAGQGRLTIWNIARSIGPPVYAATACVLYATHHVTVRSAIISWAASCGVGVAVSAVFAYRPLRLPRQVLPGPAIIRPLMSFGLRANAAAISSELNQRADQVALALMVPPAELGRYAIAATVSLSPGAVPVAYAAYAFAACARTRDPQLRLRRGQAFARRGWLISIGVYATMIMIAPVLVRMTFGPQYNGAVPTARWLCVGAALLFGASVSAAVLKAIDRPGDAARAQLIALGITVVGLVVLVPRLGIAGAAITTVAAYATAAAILIFSLWRAVHRAHPLDAEASPATPVHPDEKPVREDAKP